MECHASKNNLRDHKGQRSMTSTLLKSNSWLFFIVLRQKRVLVACEDGSFMFFCSGSQCSGCLTDVKFFTVFTIDFIHDTS